LSSMHPDKLTANKITAAANFRWLMVPSFIKLKFLSVL